MEFNVIFNTTIWMLFLFTVPNGTSTHPAFTWSKLTIGTLGQGGRLYSKLTITVIINFEHILHLLLVFLLLNLNK